MIRAGRQVGRNVPLGVGMGALRPKGLFLAHEGHLRGGRGGVQLCSQEYFHALTAAGIELEVIEIPTDRRWRARLSRRLRPGQYGNMINETAVLGVLTPKLRGNIAYVFLNQRSLAVLAEGIRSLARMPCRIVVLSHGLESVDYYHGLRIGNGLAPLPRGRWNVGTLGELLLAEGRQDRAVDHIFCLSEFEAGVERWLGARDVTLVPRTVTTSRLDWAPRSGRFGFVGTLSHPPNAEGLLLFLDALCAIGTPGVRVAVVGGPKEYGERLALRYALVDYLGPLDDRDLEEEARTWNCFVHPLFCLSRGVSTKLATAIGWELPIATTPPGCRGYVWKAGTLAQATNPASLARLAVSMMDMTVALEVRDNVRLVRESTPVIAEVAEIVRQALKLPPFP